MMSNQTRLNFTYLSPSILYVKKHGPKKEFCNTDILRRYNNTRRHKVRDSNDK